MFSHVGPKPWKTTKGESTLHVQIERVMARKADVGMGEMGETVDEVEKAA